MESTIPRQSGVQTSRRRRLKRVLIHGLVGAIAGYLVLHPLSMLIHYKCYQPEAGELDFLAHSFSARHLAMGLYFAALGALAGMIQGLYAHRLKILYEKAKALSLTDELTSLYNRRHFLDELEREIKRAKRYDKPLCLVIIDADHFKQYNDTYGHLAGDDLLKEFAGLIKASVRGTDIVGRYGGDEFVVVMPETTKAAAYNIAERLRSKAQEHPFSRRETQPDSKVTISIGIAEFPSDGRDLQQLIKEADTAMYKAKKLGRNRICLANERCLATDSRRY